LHADGVVELSFGPLATTGGAAPSWNGASCSAAYCHGNFANGATANAPVWTGVNQAACGTCHALPPPGLHPVRTDCATCHPGYTSTTVDLNQHVDGVLEVSLTCTSCHGDATRAATAVNPQLPAAPPQGTHGETATTTRAVGAHASHLNDNALSLAVACTECHAVPSSTRHYNGTVDMTFGTLARTGGASPVWNGASCSASYCHGQFTYGTTTNAPVWTGANQAACGTCHRMPPSSVRHPDHVSDQHYECYYCHGTGYVGLAATKTVNAALHVNGVVNVGGAGTNITAYNPATKSCTPTCHVTRTWR
jgi:predicted CxxxxCH...CXXCH cytochrome family protein